MGEVDLDLILTFIWLKEKKNCSKILPGAPKYDTQERKKEKLWPQICNVPIPTQSALTYFVRGSINILWLTSCFIGFESATLLCWNYQQIHLLVWQSYIKKRINSISYTQTDRQIRKLWYKQTVGQWFWFGWQRGSSDTRGPQFKSSHWKIFITNICTVNCWKEVNKEKEAGNGPQIAVPKSASVFTSDLQVF